MQLSEAGRTVVTRTEKMEENESHFPRLDKCRGKDPRGLATPKLQQRAAHNHCPESAEN